MEDPTDTGRIYMCIDLKSFYASVECVDRGLDPFTTDLVVADPERSATTICLAITPALKEKGVRNRCRVYEIPAGMHYMMARPRMRRYMEVSAHIYSVYLRYISAEDIHVYSIDECFIDATPYLSLYDVTPKELAIMLMDAVFAETGICATAGIGTNLFLAKVALDVTAKHVPDHIGYLDGKTFRETLGTHRPITDIWNIGPGTATRLARFGVHDLDGVCDLDESVLYSEFGVNAEYLIDHAHGIEPCTMAQIHAFEPEATSMTNGQILPADYTYDEALMVLKEMVGTSALELVDRHMVCTGVSLYIGYARKKGEEQEGPVFIGEHGKRGPGGHRGRHVSCSRKLAGRTASRHKLMQRLCELFEELVDPSEMIRRINIGFSDLVPEEFEDVNLFTDYAADAKERARQKAVIDVKKKFGKNALIAGTSLNEKATARERNSQVGGHRA